MTEFFPFFFILFFFGALFWAKSQDPFSRQWFNLKAANLADGCNDTFGCVAVLPKSIRRCPVVVYAHGWGGDLMYDGTDLRQMAELGLAAVSLEYDQSNNVAFDAQFASLLHYLAQQKWVNTNEVAWVGFSLGANRMWDFALQHPTLQPQLLVQLSGAGLSEGQTNSRLRSLHCPVLLVHGEQDEIFPVAGTERLASILQSNGVPMELKILPGLPHRMEPDRAVVFRAIGEYCLTHLTGRNGGDQASVWLHYHSIAQWQADAPPFWLFCLPALTWVASWFAWRRYHKRCSSRGDEAHIKLQCHEIALRWLAGILAAWALTVTGLHLLPPHFMVSEQTLALARKYSVQPKERADFETLASQPIWQGQKLKTLLEHVELANYNRELINWQLDDKMYRDYVLSPAIKLSTNNSELSTDFDWRRPLWEEFYPRIRHESSPADAAQIVVRHLRERVTIANIENPPRDVSLIWRRQITDEAGFQIIYVAALRSVGVPARLDANGRAEFWDGSQWSAAPGPAVVSW